MYHSLMNSGQHNERVVPIPPHHQQTRMSWGGVLHKVLFLPSDEQLPVPDTHQALWNPIMLQRVGKDGVRSPTSTNEITVVTGRADSGFVERDLGPKQGVVDLEVRRRGGEPLQNISHSHPEHGQHRRRLCLGRVGIYKQLNWHLSIRLHHSPHGCLLSSVADRIDV